MMQRFTVKPHSWIRVPYDIPKRPFVIQVTAADGSNKRMCVEIENTTDTDQVVDIVVADLK